MFVLLCLVITTRCRSGDFAGKAELLNGLGSD